MPFWPGKGDTVYLGDQNVVLMDVERMVRKRAIVHRPFEVDPERVTVGAAS